jgi:hypothetical protein
MRYVLGFVCVFALGLMGCGETTGTGGSGGAGGMPECESANDCDDGNDCTEDTCADGTCSNTAVADETACGEGAGKCQAGSCSGTFACTEQGIREAIAVGGGPHFFSCEGPEPMVLEAQITIDNDVILDGRGFDPVFDYNLSVDGSRTEFAVVAAEGVTAELRRFAVTRTGDGVGCRLECAAVVNSGTLTLTEVTIAENAIAIAILNVGTGTLKVTKTTVSENGTGILNIGEGITVTNSTLSGNAAAAVDGRGGTVVLTSCTVSGTLRGAMSVASSVVEGGCTRYVTSNGYNIESPGDTCGFGQSGDTPGMSAERLKLGELADNGGTTMTHALEAGSEAIDVIPAEDCVDAEGQPLTTDQRGEERPVAILGPEPKCDVGAFEVQP